MKRTTITSNRTLGIVLLATASTLLSAACDEEADSLTGLGKRGAETGEESTAGATLECTQAPQGRSYATFDGTKLEESRENENVGVNRARVKPFAAMEKEFQRVLGVVPPSLKDSAGSFDVPATRWFGETQYSAVSLHAMSQIAYEGCLAFAKASPSFATAPTETTAKEECTKLMRKAWSRSPSPEEVSGCADLAVKGLADEKDATRRWAYACVSVISATQFLTF
jgi:hypothetical protein